MCEMKVRWLAAAGIAAATLAVGPGCVSNLKVHKVPVAERATGTDCQHGFRYYLNRPYLAVKEPILVARTTSLVRVSYPTSAAAAANPSDVQLTFLDGPRQGQTARVGDLQFEAPGSGLVRAASPDELAAVHAAMTASRSGAVVPAQNVTATAAGVSVPTDGSAAANLSPGGRPGAARAATAETEVTLPTIPEDLEKINANQVAGAMEVLYLPDLDEQYAVKSCNFLGKSSFGLIFRNGGELAQVDGDHDSTPVALALLEQVKNAITQAAGVESERIKKQAKLLEAQQPSKEGGTAFRVGDPASQPVWQIVEQTWIKPGVYRLNKPWETDCGPAPQAVGCGLLAKLGLPTVVTVDYKPAAGITAQK